MTSQSIPAPLPALGQGLLRYALVTAATPLLTDGTRSWGSAGSQGTKCCDLVILAWYLRCRAA